MEENKTSLFRGLKQQKPRFESNGIKIDVVFISSLTLYKMLNESSDFSVN